MAIFFVYVRFDCIDWNARINYLLAQRGFQSRFRDNFYDTSRLIDTPHHSIEGYIVNVGCDGFLNLFWDVCNFPLWI